MHTWLMCACGRCVAVRCSVLQCVAVCCSVMNPSLLPQHAHMAHVCVQKGVIDPSVCMCRRLCEGNVEWIFQFPPCACVGDDVREVNMLREVKIPPPPLHMRMERKPQPRKKREPKKNKTITILTGASEVEVRRLWSAGMSG